VSLDRTERTGLPGHDSGIKRAVDKGFWAEQLEQDSWDRAAGTEQPGRNGRDRTSRQDSWYKTAWTGHPGQDSRDRKVGTGELGQASQKDRQIVATGNGTTTAAERGYLGQDIQLRQGNRDGTTVPVERGNWDMTSEMGPLEQDTWDRTSGTGQ
jgi:hypothetical protein